MRVANVSWGLWATLLVASAVQADEPFGASDDSPRFMLYVHKQVGAARHKSMGPSFGFAIEKPMLSRRSESLTVQPASGKLLDLRYAPYDGGSFFVNGLQLTGKSSDRLGWESYGAHPVGWSLLGVAVAAAIACAAGVGPCDDDDDDEHRTSDTSAPQG